MFSYKRLSDEDDESLFSERKNKGNSGCQVPWTKVATSCLLGYLAGLVIAGVTLLYVSGGVHSQNYSHGKGLPFISMCYLY